MMLSVVLLTFLSQAMAFSLVPTSHFGIGQTMKPRSKSPTPVPRDLSLHMGSRAADKAKGKQIWLEKRGGMDSPASSGSDAADPIKLIIAGAPASGKGTQCEKIKAKYGVVHLSTGDMLRAAVADQTEVGVKAKEFMDSGKLVPDEVIIGVVQDRLQESDCQTQGWLLDGFPRTQAQAQALAYAGVEADCFVFLNVPDEVLIERVVGRRTDPETGKIYHMSFSPPPENIVDRLEQRSDDTEEKAMIRLEQFHTNVDAVKDSYTDISVTIDGNQAPDVVSEAIFAAVDAKLTAA